MVKFVMAKDFLQQTYTIAVTVSHGFEWTDVITGIYMKHPTK